MDDDARRVEAARRCDAAWKLPRRTYGADTDESFWRELADLRPLRGWLAENKGVANMKNVELAESRRGKSNKQKQKGHRHQTFRHQTCAVYGGDNQTKVLI